MTHVFSRSANPLPSVASAEGVWVTDTDGKRYLDGCGGALVVNLGHGRREVVEAMTEQAGRVSYVHGTMFTSEVAERYAAKLATVLPMEDAYVYPVAGGSEAVETAFKMARSFHLARGDRARHKIVSRFGSYHGNTRGALDASGRAPLRNPYLPWLDKAVRVPEVYEYRCPMPGHPEGCGKQHATWLERVLLEEVPGTVAAFIAEPIGGATLGATVPCDDYWPAIAEVCRKHGVLIIADEVLTGFGRTGKWFASDWWDLKPDILTAGKGCGSGYWPLGFAACSGELREAMREGGFVHGFTYSHHVVGAAVGEKVFDILQRDDLVEASRTKGERLHSRPRHAGRGRVRAGPRYQAPLQARRAGHGARQRGVQGEWPAGVPEHGVGAASRRRHHQLRPALRDLRRGARAARGDLRRSGEVSDLSAGYSPSGRWSRLLASRSQPSRSRPSTATEEYRAIRVLPSL
jgi:adenosylmethionine-8-amino-7-oxononanoate aminotransferase